MTFTKDDFKRVVWTFLQAFVAALIVGLAALGPIPDTWDEGKTVGVALLVAAFSAGLSALKNLFLVDGTWAK